MPRKMLCKPKGTNNGIEIEEKCQFRCHVNSPCAPQKRKKRFGAYGMATKMPKKTVFDANFNYKLCSPYFQGASALHRNDLPGQKVCLLQSTVEHWPEDGHYGHAGCGVHERCHGTDLCKRCRQFLRLPQDVHLIEIPHHGI